MGWKSLELALYLCAIANYCYAFWSLMRSDAVNTVISMITFLILIKASVEFGEED